jgi:hypothetical protein
MDDHLKAKEIVTQAEMDAKEISANPHSHALGVLMVKYDSLLYDYLELKKSYEETCQSLP